MNPVPVFGLKAARAWILGMVAIFALSACALSPRPNDQNANADLVDIGYGTAERDHLTGSVNTVDTDDQPAGTFRSLGEMIQANVPGVIVQEGQGGRLLIRVRGANSLLASEEPLFVLDGVILQSADGLVGINPNVVETITVLKDAGSTAIYGSRGANGVILIKTKGGG